MSSRNFPTSSQPTKQRKKIKSAETSQTTNPETTNAGEDCIQSDVVPENEKAHQQVINISRSQVQFNNEAYFPQDASTPTSLRHPCKEKNSVIRIRQPIHDFSPTKKYTELLEIAKQRSFLILHCYGVPGSGKSEIVRKIGEQFPFVEGENKPLCVKWHIQCSDSGNDIKTELKELVNHLCTSGILSEDERSSNVIQGIDNDTASGFIDFLQKASIPVLIIIEDMDKNIASKKFANDLLRTFEKVRSNTKLHIYMATRNKKVALSESEIKQMSHYKLASVTGFDQEEGLNFLLNAMENIDEENKCSARDVYNMFSGSPLGMRAAIGYCKDSMINYTEYLELLKTSKEFVPKATSDKLIKEYGNHVMLLFQAIMIPFQVNEDSDKEDKLELKILYCLSYMNYDRVPRFLLIEYFRKLKVGESESYTVSKMKSGKLISKLRDHEMCTLTDEQEITFHEVVTHAFRYGSQSENANFHLGEFNPFKDAIMILVGVITKDMKSTNETRKRMFKLIPHAKRLLENVEAGLEELKKERDWDLIRLLISHVYETFGAIMLAKSSTYHDISAMYLKKALEIIWDKKRLDLFKRRNNPEEIAKKVIERFENEDFSQGFLDRYESSLFINLDEKAMEYLCKNSRETPDFEQVKSAVSTKGLKNIKLIGLLRACGVFLDEMDYGKVFYLERIASILHVKSRLILYADNPSESTFKESKWNSSLAYAISVECRNTYGTGLLVEHFSRTSGMIPILLSKKKDSNILMKAKQMCEEMLDKKRPEHKLYEHGLLKEVYGPTHDIARIQILRNLLKIYGRVVKNQPNVKEAAGNHCLELSELAEKHFSHLPGALHGFINCGKYYAAIEDYGKAIEYFNKFLKSCESGMHNVRPWGVYNYARAVLTGNLQTLRSDALKLCEEALSGRDEMGNVLNILLKDAIRKLLIT